MRWILITLLMPIVAGNAEIDIIISGNDLADQHIVLYPDITGPVKYHMLHEPVAVTYEGDYEISEQDGIYTLIFPYNEKLDVNIISDGMVEKDGKRRIFRAVFEQDTELSITLPRQYVLSSNKPNVLPNPTDISTDGERITIRWNVENEPVSVFYEGKSNTLWIMAIALLILTAIVLAIMFGKKHKQVQDMLSVEEKDVLAALKSVNRQDHIAKKLGYSKSKMSKVLRKLEEKKIIKKEPYFKTNIIKKK